MKKHGIAVSLLSASCILQLGAKPPAGINPHVKFPVFDVRKSSIENPVKRVFAQKGVTGVPPTTRKTDSHFSNPKVKPGDVNWHPDFATAQKFAKRNRKPILLFQMIGRLDERFT
ncbi:MAG: hypothetical protein Tsb009_03260 [Planctomycetaceae bacterium]